MFSTSDVSAFGGETVEIEAALLGPPTGKLTYRWIVPKGAIKSGQGTSRIEIALPNVKNRKRIDLGVTVDGLASASPCNPLGQISIFLKGPRDWEHGISRLAALAINHERLAECPDADESKPNEGNLRRGRHVNVISIPQDIGSIHLLNFNYWVSGGVIRGKGQNVTWDLSDVGPGTYAVSASIDDGCGLCGPQLTRFVTVEACRRQSSS